jgi:hypothetical protein
MLDHIASRIRQVVIAGIGIVIWSTFILSIEYFIVLADLPLLEKIRNSPGITACALAASFLGGGTATVGVLALRNSHRTAALTTFLTITAITFGFLCYASILLSLRSANPSTAIGFLVTATTMTAGWTAICIRTRMVFLGWISTSDES